MKFTYDKVKVLASLLIFNETVTTEGDRVKIQLANTTCSKFQVSTTLDFSTLKAFFISTGKNLSQGNQYMYNPKTPK